MKIVSFYLCLQLLVLGASAQHVSLLKDIIPGSQGNSYQLDYNEVWAPEVRNVLVTDDAFYFYSVDKNGKIGFWRSDGTAKGTLPLIETPFTQGLNNLISGEQAQLPAVLFQNQVHFVWSSTEQGSGIWKTDGTSKGTAVAITAQDGTYASPRNLILANNQLFFTTGNSYSNTNLWVSDGTPIGTVPVPINWKSTTGKDIINPVELNGSLYFITYGAENDGIWKTDGKAAGTKFLYPVDFTWLIPAYGSIYFPTPAAPDGQILWRLDDTNDQVEQLATLATGAGISYPHMFKKAAGKLFFVAHSQTDTTTLYVTDGSPAGTVNIAIGNIYSTYPFADKLYLSQVFKKRILATKGISNELENSTDIAASHIEFLQASDTILYFSAYDAETGVELWRTNGQQNGTYRIADIRPGIAHSSPSDAFFFKEKLYFFANDGVHGKELWHIADPSSIISGRLYFDSNKNNSADPNEIGVWKQKVLIMPDEIELYTNTKGEYSWAAEKGTYTVQVIPNANWQVKKETDTKTLSIPGFEKADFALQATSELKQSALVLLTPSTPARCSTIVNYWLDYTNTGNEMASGQVQLMIDKRATLTYSYPAPTNQENGTLSWSYDNLLPSQQRKVQLQFSMPDFNSMGDTIRFYSQASITGTNIIAKDTLDQVITCSYDPNDKLVKPAGIEDEHLTLKNSWLDYTIRFQNTGNDTAFVVVLKDTLDANLDLKSFEILGSSHTMQASRKERALAFRFDDIKLPDSTRDEPNSHGYVRYRIKAKAGVPEKTVVENKAYIFFDFNPAVETNTTFNTLVTTLPQRVVNGWQAHKLQEIRFYPNPTKGSFTLVAEAPVEQVRVYNSMGTLLHQQHFKQVATEQTLSVEQLPAGLYLVKVTAGKKQYRQTLIKQ